MAAREFIRCTVCGSLRKPEAFGIGPDGYLDSDVRYEVSGATQEIGGRGRCSWASHDLPLHLAIALRRRMKDALDELDAELMREGVDESVFAADET